MILNFLSNVEVLILMILMIMLLNDKSKVSKLGLAVNSLVFGGFQPVDVLADIRLDLVHPNSQVL